MLYFAIWCLIGILAYFVSWWLDFDLDTAVKEIKKPAAIGAAFMGPIAIYAAIEIYLSNKR